MGAASSWWWRTTHRVGGFVRRQEVLAQPLPHTHRSSRRRLVLVDGRRLRELRHCLLELRQGHPVQRQCEQQPRRYLWVLALEPRGRALQGRAVEPDGSAVREVVVAGGGAVQERGAVRDEAVAELQVLETPAAEALVESADPVIEVAAQRDVAGQEAEPAHRRHGPS